MYLPNTFVIRSYYKCWRKYSNYNFWLWHLLPSVQLENQIDMVVSLWRTKHRFLSSEPYVLSFLVCHHWVHKYFNHTSFYCQIRFTFCVIREELKAVCALIFTSEIHYSTYLGGQSDELWIFICNLGIFQLPYASYVCLRSEVHYFYTRVYFKTRQHFIYSSLDILFWR